MMNAWIPWTGSLSCQPTAGLSSLSWIISFHFFHNLAFDMVAYDFLRFVVYLCNIVFTSYPEAGRHKRRRSEGSCWEDALCVLGVPSLIPVTSWLSPPLHHNNNITILIILAISLKPFIISSKPHIVLVLSMCSVVSFLSVWAVVDGRPRD